ncbi:major facilitator superfamily MFS_1 [Halarchaeum acidiphilum MH1-52-1]|uniref:Major facilitator superfamily MFS_1 n=1 Tax=Halarchaeum acidiphilum MH1-52-1 TaxID=1261545 RepID=U3A927_9EURY|nr:MFS transporter [Halarchaeum acidiphilum]GAD51263.1 major facilitator superfamily MFS_1 [Halarchaeum acidiphilum MH1-52-1]
MTATDTGRRTQFLALHLVRFAGRFGFSALVVLLPYYVNRLDASGLTTGLFYTGFTAAQLVAVVPIAWAGDRYDKRLVLLGALGFGGVVYALFTLVETPAALVGIRALQGIVVVAVSLLTLAFVGELATPETRANEIGKSNAARFAAAIAGSIAVGLLYPVVGFAPIFWILVAFYAVTFLAVVFVLQSDTTTIRGFPFSGLAFNERIRTLSVFRAQYAVAVTLVRTWVPLFAGVVAARGGLGMVTLAVSLVVVAEKLMNLVLQPAIGSLSDRYGRALFVFIGGGFYGVVALAIPFTPAIGTALSLPETIPGVGYVSAAFLPLLALNALLGVTEAFREPASMALFADEGSSDETSGVAASFGVRDLVWRPGSLLAPIVGGWLMGSVGMDWVFYLGGLAALVGVTSFLLVLVRAHGRGALTEW